MVGLVAGVPAVVLLGIVDISSVTWPVTEPVMVSADGELLAISVVSAEVLGRDVFGLMPPPVVLRSVLVVV